MKLTWDAVHLSNPLWSPLLWWILGRHFFQFHRKSPHPFACEWLPWCHCHGPVLQWQQSLERTLKNSLPFADGKDQVRLELLELFFLFSREWHLPGDGLDRLRELPPNAIECCYSWALQGRTTASLNVNTLTCCFCMPIFWQALQHGDSFWCSHDPQMKICLTCELISNRFTDESSLSSHCLSYTELSIMKRCSRLC